MALMEMDPYLHVEDGVNYPPMLITAGFNDSKVIVWQPAKFAARMVEATNARQTILFNVDYSSGHASQTKTKSMEELLDVFAFFLWQTGHPEFQE